MGDGKPEGGAQERGAMLRNAALQRRTLAALAVAFCVSAAALALGGCKSTDQDYVAPEPLPHSAVESTGVDGSARAATLHLADRFVRCREHEQPSSCAARLRRDGVEIVVDETTYSITVQAAPGASFSVTDTPITGVERTCVPAGTPPCRRNGTWEP